MKNCWWVVGVNVQGQVWRARDAKFKNSWADNFTFSKLVQRAGAGNRCDTSKQALASSAIPECGRQRTQVWQYRNTERVHQASGPESCRHGLGHMAALLLTVCSKQPPKVAKRLNTQLKPEARCAQKLRWDQQLGLVALGVARWGSMRAPGTSGAQQQGGYEAHGGARVYF
ncbi:hypothetical protein SS50377_27756 [Spironucleus salmonicida]|uniref:Uncharacterized protein n=1 Tax=Spironucleus salmonicida TaxID=348837 RepID=A0A9P8LKN6_9EUKA|nr:hypothetical protein SS50377_27756 [Spironucleus salmonicida]